MEKSLYNAFVEEISSWNHKKLFSFEETPNGGKFSFGSVSCVVVENNKVSAQGKSPFQKEQNVSYRTEKTEAAVRRSVRFAVHYKLSHENALETALETARAEEERRANAAKFSGLAALVGSSAPVVASLPSVVVVEEEAPKTAKKAKKTQEETPALVLPLPVIETQETPVLS